MESSFESIGSVASVIRSADPSGDRTGSVLRRTFDQLYDGQRTGRYDWGQLHKTEKTHFGTVVEINMQREFGFADGGKLDFKIAGVEVDCKFSQNYAKWMIPIEARGEVCLGLWASDRDSRWSMGLFRATESMLSKGNRDGKASLKVEARSRILWLFDRAELPPNVLLHLPSATVSQIMSGRSGAARVRELFRLVQGRRISRGVVATVAQQADYMKRIRGNGGARTSLRAEGIVVLGQFDEHRRIARSLGLPVPKRGESVSVRLARSDHRSPKSVEVDGTWWRVARLGDPMVEAPLLVSS